MIFQHITEISSKVTGVSQNLDLDQLTTGILEATSEVKNYISENIYKEIEGAYKNSDSKYEELISLTQTAIANLLISSNVGILSLKIDNSGVTTRKTDNETTAFKYQTDEAKKRYLQSAYWAISEIHKLLEENKNEIWLNSKERKVLHDCFFNNYCIYKNYAPIEVTPLLYYKTINLINRAYKDVITRIEFHSIDSSHQNYNDIAEAIANKSLASAIVQLDSKFLPINLVGNEFKQGAEKYLSNFGNRKELAKTFDSNYEELIKKFIDYEELEDEELNPDSKHYSIC
jgi:hypothetical protein